MLSSAGGPQRGVREPHGERKDSCLGGKLLVLALSSGSRDTRGNRERFGRFVVSVWGTACEERPREEAQLDGKDMGSFLTCWSHELHAVAEQWLSLDALV